MDTGSSKGGQTTTNSPTMPGSGKSEIGRREMLGMLLVGPIAAALPSPIPPEPATASLAARAELFVRDGAKFVKVADVKSLSISFGPRPNYSGIPVATEQLIEALDDGIVSFGLEFTHGGKETT